MLSPRFPHTNQKAVPRTVLEQQLTDALRFNPDWHYAYAQRPRIPSSDTGNYPFITLGLVEFSPIGPGDRIRTPIRALASNGRPMVFFKTVYPQGLGGLVQGQIFGQTLYNPNPLIGKVP